MICKHCGILVTEINLLTSVMEMTVEVSYISDLKYSGLENGLDCPKSPYQLHYPRESSVQTQE